MEKEFITLEKKQALEKELLERKTIIREEIGERVATARALGDLSENAEYHAARNEQGKNETRIIQIESLLKHSEIIIRTQSEIVELGATVTVSRDGEEKTFMIVSDSESDIAQGKISTNSPMGTAMVGKRAGEAFSVMTPRGTEISYIIIMIN